MNARSSAALYFEKQSGLGNLDKELESAHALTRKLKTAQCFCNKLFHEACLLGGSGVVDANLRHFARCLNEVAGLQI